ncbi:MAG: hypothetical protein JW863_16915 [Chitinispirillaceae bacterium]|nr:hypothetical protein [Chitinispirillaceae bacterium]
MQDTSTIAAGRTAGPIPTVAFLSAVIAMVLTGFGHSHASDGPPEEFPANVRKWLTTVNDPAETADSKTVALDSLVEQHDPALLDTIKYFAFRYPDRSVNLTAVDRMNRFVLTYRWTEVCDTLTDLMLYSSDPEIRYAALYANRITATAFVYQLPFDRNRVVDALVTMVAPDTYFNEAKGFYTAVWLLANVAVDSDRHAIDALTYLRDHYEEYTLENGIDATDAYQLFRNNIQSTYIDLVESYPLPPLIDTIPVDATTEDYLSTVGYMLDSAATDSLGFAALAWLLEHGEAVNGDEGDRLLYFRRTAPWKRPDRAAEITAAIEELFDRFGVAVTLDRPVLSRMPPDALIYYRLSGSRLAVSRIPPGSRLCLFDFSGRLLFHEVTPDSPYYAILPAGFAAKGIILTVNGMAIPIKTVSGK